MLGELGLHLTWDRDGGEAILKLFERVEEMVDSIEIPVEKISEIESALDQSFLRHIREILDHQESRNELTAIYARIAVTLCEEREENEAS